MSHYNGTPCDLIKCAIRRGQIYTVRYDTIQWYEMKEFDTILYEIIQHDMIQWLIIFKPLQCNTMRCDLNRFITHIYILFDTIRYATLRYSWIHDSFQYRSDTISVHYDMIPYDTGSIVTCASIWYASTWYDCESLQCNTMWLRFNTHYKKLFCNQSEISCTKQTMYKTDPRQWEQPELILQWLHLTYTEQKCCRRVVSCHVPGACTHLCSSWLTGCISPPASCERAPDERPAVLGTGGAGCVTETDCRRARKRGLTNE